MKKLLLCITCVFMFFNLKAQNYGEFQFGIGAGLNISNAIIDNKEIQTNPLSTFNVAVSTEYYVDNRWGIKTKLIYDNKGWKSKITNPLNTLELIKTNNQLNYISIPLMANFHFGSIQSRAKSFVTRPWYMSLGPYIGFLTKAEESEFNVNFKETLKTFDYGAAFNFGLRFEIAQFTKFFVEYDAQYGLADISLETTTSVTNDKATIKNGLRHSINLGFLFAFY